MYVCVSELFTPLSLIQIIYMLVALVVIYVITVIPAWMDRLLYTLNVRLGPGFDNVRLGALFSLVQSMNSSTNVIVYAIISRQVVPVKFFLSEVLSI